MDFWDDIERLKWWSQCLNWMMITILPILAILIGAARYILDNREKYLTRVATNTEIVRIQARTAPRTLKPTPEMLEPLIDTDPHNLVYVVFDDFENEIMEYAHQWKSLLHDTRWGGQWTKFNQRAWKDSKKSEYPIQPGITLVIREENAYTTRFRDMLLRSGLSIKVIPPESSSTFFDFTGSNKSVLLLIGRRS